MGKTISAKNILENDYPLLHVSEHMKRIIGDAEIGFTMLIWGESGSGKTTFAIRDLATYLAANHGKVYYNSREQGEGAGIQKILSRCDLASIKDGRFMFGDRDTWSEMIHKIKTIHPRYIFIDSSDYLNMTSEQYKQLLELCHKGSKRQRKSIIIISWARNENPKSQYMCDVRYMVDIKCRVVKGVTLIDSRFGATDSWHIFKRQFVKAPLSAQKTLFK